MKTIRSIELQASTILESLHVGDIEIRKIRPFRKDIGNFVRITYHTSMDPELLLCQNFALQRVGDCCDVWLDLPANQYSQNIGNDAA